MVLALCPVITFADETAAPTVEAVDVGTKGTAAQQAGLTGMTGDIVKSYYLSDWYKGGRMVESVNSKVTLDTNYNNDLYAFNGQGGRKRIASDAVDGYRTIENGLTYHISEIALGYLGTKYEKGLGVHPNGVGAADRSITYNVSGLDADRFYAVVGANGKEIIKMENIRRVEFEVWGSVDGTNFVQLARADKIRAYVIAELDVNIEGYNYIKLVVKMDPTSESNASSAAVWADACV